MNPNTSNIITIGFKNSFSHIRIHIDVTRLKDSTKDPPNIPNPDHKIGKNYNYTTRDPEMVIFLFLIVIYFNFF